MSSRLPSSLARLPPRVFPPCGASPRRGQKEVSTQHARCWIGCYFSRPTGPNPAQGRGGGSGDRTCRAEERGQNFPVFYPFATQSPIEKNGSLRANRRGWPGSGPPARPRESCQEGKSSRNQWRNRRGRDSCQQTQLYHVTRQRHRNTPTHTAAQRAGAGQVEGSQGPPSCPLQGRRGGGGGRVNA